MNEINIVILDRDAEFCRRLDGCLRSRLPFPVNIHDYTDPEPLRSYTDREETTALLVAEGSLDGAPIEGFPRVIILSEGLGIEYTQPESSSESAKQQCVKRINKYRSLGTLISEVTQCCMDSDIYAGRLMADTGEKARITGFFTPVTRCLQTTAAMTLGQLYAAEKKTLYINLEPFSGLVSGGMIPQGDGDLAELLYYYECEPGKLALHLERMCIQAGALKMIPPASAFSSIMETEPGKWTEFLRSIACDTDLQMIILDLSVCVRGLFDVMRGLDRIITIERGDPVSAGKLSDYDRMLRRSGHDDILAKTKRLQLPVIEKLPADPARYAEGRLAAIMRELMREDSLHE